MTTLKAGADTRSQADALGSSLARPLVATERRVAPGLPTGIVQTGAQSPDRDHPNSFRVLLTDLMRPVNGHLQSPAAEGSLRGRLGGLGPCCAQQHQAGCSHAPQRAGAAGAGCMCTRECVRV